ncbi:unnamed protein product [Amoebophrya sp. A25]|nr:unnamed protein product [Amoebophrya sp. A25]|eukprot:GSA25T00023676001.1
MSGRFGKKKEQDAEWLNTSQLFGDGETAFGGDAKLADERRRASFGGAVFSSPLEKAPAEDGESDVCGCSDVHATYDDGAVDGKNGIDDIVREDGAFRRLEDEIGFDPPEGVTPDIGQSPDVDHVIKSSSACSCPDELIAVSPIMEEAGEDYGDAARTFKDDVGVDPSVSDPAAGSPNESSLVFQSVEPVVAESRLGGWNRGSASSPSASLASTRKTLTFANCATASSGREALPASSSSNNPFAVSRSATASTFGGSGSKQSSASVSSSLTSSPTEEKITAHYDNAKQHVGGSSQHDAAVESLENGPGASLLFGTDEVARAGFSLGFGSGGGGESLFGSSGTKGSIFGHSRSSLFDDARGDSGSIFASYAERKKSIEQSKNGEFPRNKKSHVATFGSLFDKTDFRLADLEEQNGGGRSRMLTLSQRFDNTGNKASVLSPGHVSSNDNDALEMSADKENVSLHANTSSDSETESRRGLSRQATKEPRAALKSSNDEEEKPAFRTLLDRFKKMSVSNRSSLEGVPTKSPGLVSPSKPIGSPDSQSSAVSQQAVGAHASPPTSGSGLLEVIDDEYNVRSDRAEKLPIPGGPEPSEPNVATAEAEESALAEVASPQEESALEGEDVIPQENGDEAIFPDHEDDVYPPKRVDEMKLQEAGAAGRNKLDDGSHAVYESSVNSMEVVHPSALNHGSTDSVSSKKAGLPPRPAETQFHSTREVPGDDKSSLVERSAIEGSLVERSVFSAASPVDMRLQNESEQPSGSRIDDEFDADLLTPESDISSGGLACAGEKEGRPGPVRLAVEDEDHFSDVGCNKAPAASTGATWGHTEDDSVLGGQNTNSKEVEDGNKETAGRPCHGSEEGNFSSSSRNKEFEARKTALRAGSSPALSTFGVVEEEASVVHEVGAVKAVERGRTLMDDDELFEEDAEADTSLKTGAAIKKDSPLAEVRSEMSIEGKNSASASRQESRSGSSTANLSTLMESNPLQSSTIVSSSSCLQESHEPEKVDTKKTRGLQCTPEKEKPRASGLFAGVEPPPQEATGLFRRSSLISRPSLSNRMSIASAGRGSELQAAPNATNSSVLLEPQYSKPTQDKASNAVDSAASLANDVKLKANESVPENKGATHRETGQGESISGDPDGCQTTEQKNRVGPVCGQEDHVGDNSLSRCDEEELPIGMNKSNDQLPPETVLDPDYSGVPLSTRLVSSNVKERVSAWHDITRHFSEGIDPEGASIGRPPRNFLNYVPVEQLPVGYEAALHAATAYATWVGQDRAAWEQESALEWRNPYAVGSTEEQLVDLTSELLDHKQMGERKLQLLFIKLWVAVGEALPRSIADVCAQLINRLQQLEKRVATAGMSTAVSSSPAPSGHAAGYGSGTSSSFGTAGQCSAANAAAKIGVAKKQMVTVIMLLAKLLEMFGNLAAKTTSNYDHRFGSSGSSAATNMISVESVTRPLALVSVKHIQDRVLRDICYTALAEIQCSIGEKQLLEWVGGRLSEPQKRELQRHVTTRVKGSCRANNRGSGSVPTNTSQVSSTRTSARGAPSASFGASAGRKTPASRGISGSAQSFRSGFDAISNSGCGDDGTSIFGKGTEGRDNDNVEAETETPWEDFPEFDLMTNLPKRYALAALESMTKWQDKKDHLAQLSKVLHGQRRLRHDDSIAVLLPALCKLLKAEQNHMVLAEAALIVANLARGLPVPTTTETQTGAGKIFGVSGGFVGTHLLEKHGRTILRTCFVRLSDKNLWKVVEDAAFTVWKAIRPAGDSSWQKLLEDLKFEDTSPHARLMSVRFLHRCLTCNKGPTCSISFTLPEPQRLGDVRAIALRAGSEDAEKPVRDMALALLADLCFVAGTSDEPEKLGREIFEDLPVSRRKAFEQVFRESRKRYKETEEKRKDAGGPQGDTSLQTHQDVASASGGNVTTGSVVRGRDPSQDPPNRKSSPLSSSTGAPPPRSGNLFLTSSGSSSSSAPRGLSKSASERRLSLRGVSGGRNKSAVNSSHLGIGSSSFGSSTSSSSVFGGNNSSRLASPRGGAQRHRGPVLPLTLADRAAGLSDEHFAALQEPLFEAPNRVSVTGLQTLAHAWQRAPPPASAVEQFAMMLYEKTMHFADARPLAGRAFFHFFQVLATATPSSASQNQTRASSGMGGGSTPSSSSGSLVSHRVGRVIIARMVEMAADRRMSEGVRETMLDYAERLGCGFVMELVCSGGSRTSGSAGNSSFLGASGGFAAASSSTLVPLSGCSSGQFQGRRLKHVEQRLGLVYDLVSAFALQNAGGIVPAALDLLREGFDSRVATERKAAFKLADLLCRYRPSAFNAVVPAVTNDEAFRRLQELYAPGRWSAEDRPPPVQTRGPLVSSRKYSGDSSLDGSRLESHSFSRHGKRESLGSSKGASRPSLSCTAKEHAPFTFSTNAHEEAAAVDPAETAKSEAHAISSEGWKSEAQGSPVSKGSDSFVEIEKLRRQAYRQSDITRGVMSSGVSHPGTNATGSGSAHAAPSSDADKGVQERRIENNGMHEQVAERDFHSREREYQRQIEDLKSQLLMQQDRSLMSEAPSSIHPALQNTGAPTEHEASVVELKDSIVAAMSSSGRQTMKALAAEPVATRRAEAESLRHASSRPPAGTESARNAEDKGGKAFSSSMLQKDGARAADAPPDLKIRGDVVEASSSSSSRATSRTDLSSTFGGGAGASGAPPPSTSSPSCAPGSGGSNKTPAFGFDPRNRASPLPPQLGGAGRAVSGNARRRSNIGGAAALSTLQVPAGSSVRSASPSGTAGNYGQSRSSTRAPSPRGGLSNSGSTRDLSLRSSRTSTGGNAATLAAAIRTFEIFEAPHYTPGSRIGGKEQRQNAFSLLWGPEDIPIDGWKQVEVEMKLAIPEAISKLMFDFSRNDDVLVALEAWSQNVATFALEVIEILDLIFRYVTFVIHKVTNMRVVNASLDLLMRVLTLLDERNYIPTEKEAMTLLPILCEKLGHNQRAVRDALCASLRRFVRLFPRGDLPKCVLLTLVRGCASKNKKSACDLLTQLEQMLLPSSASSPGGGGVGGEVSEEAVGARADQEDSSRLCLMLAKSQRDVVLLTNLVQESMGNPEMKRLGLSILYALLRGLDYETFYHCVRKNIKSGTAVLQQVDHWISRSGASLSRDPGGPSSVNSSINHGPGTSVNHAYQVSSSGSNSCAVGAHGTGHKSEHRDSMDRMLLNNSQLDQSIEIPRPPKPAQLASPTSRRPSPGGGFVTKMTSPGVSSQPRGRFSSGSPSVRSSSSRLSSAKPAYPPQYGAPAVASSSSSSREHVFTKLAEMISREDDSCIAALENDAFRLQDARRSDVAMLFEALTRCRSLSLVLAFLKSYMRKKAEAPPPGKGEAVASHLLNDFEFSSAILDVLGRLLSEVLMLDSPEVAIKLWERLNERKRTLINLGKPRRELGSQLRELEGICDDVQAFEKSGSVITSFLCSQSATAEDREVAISDMVKLLEIHFPSPLVPTQCAPAVIAVLDTLVREPRFMSLPERCLRSLLHKLLVTLNLSSAWKEKVENWKPLLESVNLTTVLLMQNIQSVVSPMLACRLVLSFSVMRERDIADSLIVKCVKKLNKGLVLPTDAAAAEARLGSWCRDVLLEFARSCGEVDRDALSPAVRCGAAIFDGLSAAAVSSQFDLRSRLRDMLLQEIAEELPPDAKTRLLLEAFVNQSVAGAAA